MYKLKEKLEVKPILKWAGGKSQLLPQLLPLIPKSYNNYVEPFIGGAALFFAVQPERAIISDSNPELINLYRCVAENVEEVIDRLRRYRNVEDEFYRIRALKWLELPMCEAAARMIYLNRTCFNGLYRVNRKGEFNVPFGRYRNPRICDEKNLRNASIVLQKADIVCADYLDVLDRRVDAGDFVFLDPPYVPVGEWGDFKRYTKEQFYDEDQVRLADAVGRLHRHKVMAVLTNSNHPRVHELYANYERSVVQTKRNVSCKGYGRNGEDVIVRIEPASKDGRRIYEESALPAQVEKYPPTRYMGSKRKLLDEILRVTSRFEFETVADVFSGSGVVGYMFKSLGMKVLSNDYMAMSSTFAKAMIENNETILSDEEVELLLTRRGKVDDFVSKTFRGLYFTDADNHVIDVIRSNLAVLKDPYKRAIALTALIRACTKKRPRGLFTYVGLRYDDGRKDLKLSMEEQFRVAVKAVNDAVFDNRMDNRARQGDALDMPAEGVDLAYFDPPYFTPKSDNEYVRRYHFLEGLARDWRGVEIQDDTITKKFKSYPTPFSTLDGAKEAFDGLFQRFKDSLLVVSYSSNSLPSQDEIVRLMSKYKQHVKVEEVDYRYHFGNRSDGRTKRDKVKEYLFIGY